MKQALEPANQKEVPIKTGEGRSEGSRKTCRVLFPYSRDRVGGSYISSSQLARYLQEETVLEPIIALPHRARNRYLFERYNLNICEHPGYGNRLLEAKWIPNRIRYQLDFYSARSFLTKVRPNFVHVHDDYSGLIWGKAAKAEGLRVVWHVRLEHRKRTDREMLRYADEIIFISEGCRWRFEQYSPLRQEASVIYNGIDLDEFTKVSEASRRRMRDQLGLPAGAIILGFVGTLVPRKRPEWAFEAFCQLLDNGIDAHLIFLGKDRGEPLLYEKTFRQNLNDARRVQRMHFLGQRREVADLVKALDVLLVPSEPHGEPFSRVIAEGCATGVPVIATEGIGALDLLDDQRDCVVTPSMDLDGFCGAVLEVCRDPARRAEISENGRRRAKEVFSYERMGAETAAFYRDRGLIGG